MSEPCPNCSTQADFYLQVPDYNRRVSKERFRYYRCPACNLIFLSPIPADLSVYYPQSYHELPASLETFSVQAEAERYKIDLLRKFRQGGRLMEIGPSVGGFAHLAKQAGFEVEAIEMDAECCRFLNETVGVRAIHTSNEKAVLEQAQPFDIFAMWHVLEHLPDPWGLLESAGRKLNRGGIMILAAPNPDSLQLRIFRRYWVHIDAPRHSCLIPMRLIVDRLSSLGMKPVFETLTDPGSLGWNAFGWAYSLGNLVNARIGNRYFNIMGRILAAAAGPVERSGRFGTAYTLVLEKNR